jgi:tetratricopeptide (TPR) repeat protein
VAAVGLALLAGALLTKRDERPVVRKAPPRPAPVPEATSVSPTSGLLRAAEEELLALCAERDRLFETRKELAGSRADAVRIETAQVEIAKHVRDGERSYAAGQYEKALREFERADFKIRSVPYEVKSLVELQPLIRAWVDKAKAALAGGPPPSVVAADEHYRQGERLFQASDFARAEAECAKALEADPNHAPARALRMEVGFLLGKGGGSSVVPRPEALVEMNGAYDRGAACFNAGDLDAAEREFRKVLELAKWAPRDAEAASRRESAIRMLERVQAARR